MSWADPHPMLSSYVRAYCGWEEEPTSPLWRIEPPGLDVPVIFLFAAPVLAPHRADLDDVKPFGSFVAGLWDHHAIVGSRGRMAGLQVNFSPIGARLLLDQPLEAFANRMIELDDVWGIDAGSRPGWRRRRGGRRLQFMDAEIAARIGPGPAGPRRAPLDDGPVAARAANLRERAVKQTGWSRAPPDRARAPEFGLYAKTLGRVLRLGSAVEGPTAPRPGPARHVAVDCGTTTRPTSRATSVSSHRTPPGAFLRPATRQRRYLDGQVTSIQTRPAGRLSTLRP